MKVSVAAVTSADGKLTRHHESNIHDWVSEEDQQHFQSLIAWHDVIVMGSGTYKEIKSSLRLSLTKLRVVLTTQPQKFTDQAVTGQLEFCNKSPAQLTASLAIRGFSNLLVTGGSQMISDFLKAKLVSQLYLTIEPRLFGAGQPLMTDMLLDIQLKLKKQQRLNDNGTILLTYRVL